MPELNSIPVDPATDVATPDVPKTEPTTPAEPKAKTDSTDRYFISKERERRKALEKENAEIKAELKKTKPVFNSENDPDGEEQIKYQVKSEVDELSNSRLNDIKSRLEKMEEEKEAEEFFNRVKEKTSEKFNKYWIEYTKEELKNSLDILNSKWVLPDQLIMLAKSEEILAKLEASKKPTSFVPWDWAKPNSNRPVTQEEKDEEIFKRFGVFGR